MNEFGTIGFIEDMLFYSVLILATFIIFLIIKYVIFRKELKDEK